MQKQYYTLSNTKNPWMLDIVYKIYNIINSSHKFWDQSPLPPLSMLFASTWDSFLGQALVLLLCQYTATL